MLYYKFAIEVVINLFCLLTLTLTLSFITHLRLVAE